MSSSSKKNKNKKKDGDKKATSTSSTTASTSALNVVQTESKEKHDKVVTATLDQPIADNDVLIQCISLFSFLSLFDHVFSSLYSFVAQFSSLSGIYSEHSKIPPFFVKANFFSFALSCLLFLIVVVVLFLARCQHQSHFKRS
jgi:hypothetical protein